MPDHGTGRELANQRSTWRLLRTITFAAWIGLGMMLIFAVALTMQRSKLPATIWNYEPGGKGSGPGLYPWSTSFAFGLMWISVAAYFVLLAILAYLWWRLRTNPKRSLNVMIGVLIVAVLAWIVINTVVANVMPQLSRVPVTRAAANDDLALGAFIYGCAFVALAVVALLGGYLVARRVNWPNCLGERASPGAE